MPKLKIYPKPTWIELAMSLYAKFHLPKDMRVLMNAPRKKK